MLSDGVKHFSYHFMLSLVFFFTDYRFQSPVLYQKGEDLFIKLKRNEILMQ